MNNKYLGMVSNGRKCFKSAIPKHRFNPDFVKVAEGFGIKEESPSPAGTCSRHSGNAQISGLIPRSKH
jgi:thiamine pyrophosphate-dependent acetolactate synthase large subunit-like protein